MLKTVQLFGFNLWSIKIPFILYSFVTGIFIFLIAQLISKKLALMSSFLYIISPWAIIQSNITRDYSFDLMIASIIIYTLFILYRKYVGMNIVSNKAWGLISFIGIILFWIGLYIFNRQQIVTTGTYIGMIFVFFIYDIVRKKLFNPLFKYIYWVVIILFLIIIGYFINIYPFIMGFREANYAFFDIFFSSLVKSPWQWFHNIKIESILVLSVFIFGFVSFVKNNNSQKLLLILGMSFFYALFVYTVKYQTHVEYIPVRYVYFLFIPYVIILSNGILNLIQIFKKYEKIIIIIILLSFVNYTELIYAVSPKIAYEKEKISNLLIDNIGIGRFNILDVIQYIKNELQITN